LQATQKRFVGFREFEKNYFFKSVRGMSGVEKVEKMIVRGNSRFENPQSKGKSAKNKLNVKAEEKLSADDSDEEEDDIKNGGRGRGKPTNQKRKASFAPSKMAKRTAQIPSLSKPLPLPPDFRNGGIVIDWQVNS